jgi:hypothetical protein
MTDANLTVFVEQALKQALQQFPRGEVYAMWADRAEISPQRIRQLIALDAADATVEELHRLANACGGRCKISFVKKSHEEKK